MQIVERNGCTVGILPYLFNLWDRSKRKWGSSEHLMRGIALLRPSNISLQCSIISGNRVARIPRPRVPFYEDEFMEGKYLHRRYFLFPRVAKLVVGSRASREPRRSLLRGWNNACVHIPEYVNLYHYVFIVFFPFFFFLCRMKEGIGGTGLDTPCQLFRIFK